MKRFSSLIFSVLIFSLANAQTAKPLSPVAIDKIVKKLMDTAEVSGLALAVIQDNKISYVKSYGYKNKAKNEWNDTATCFYAASLAKPLFAYIVMQMVDQKLIDLDKPLYTYLPKPIPEYSNYKDLAGDERWKLITARHCLDHTTGFPNWRQFNPRDNKKLEIFFTPGTRYAYSGEGLFLLQMVMETITHKGLEELAKEGIFRPFGMYRTSFLWQPAFETNYALGHDVNEDTMPKDKRTKANAAGSMETTIADYARFVSAVMNGKGLSANAWKEMFTPQIAIHSKRQFPSLDTTTTKENDGLQLSYGLGWGLLNTTKGKAFFKEGHTDGWGHYMISFPEKRSGIILMSNSSSGESIYPELVKELTSVTIPAVWELYTPYTPTVSLPLKSLEELTGNYTGKFNAKIELINGRLKVSSEMAGLPPTNLYAKDASNLFMKTMDLQIKVNRNAAGKIDKLLVTDDGEHFDLVKQ